MSIIKTTFLALLLVVLQPLVSISFAVERILELHAKESKIKTEE